MIWATLIYLLIGLAYATWRFGSQAELPGRLKLWLIMLLWPLGWVIS